MPRKIYQKKKPKSFFTKNGRELKSYKDFNAVYSLLEQLQPRKEQVLAITDLVFKKSKFNQIKERLGNLGEIATQKIRQIRQIDKLRLSMMSLGINAALLLALVFVVGTNSVNQRPISKYSIFSSKPLTVLGASVSLFGGDPRAATIDKIMDAYNCPLAGKGKVFVKEADNNGIPYWLLAAIAFQESGCGKYTPKTGGEESYNAWGWGVWGKNVRMFENWDEGIKTISRYMGDNFYSKGVTNTCEIMRIYTPSSNGSWCLGVNYYGDIIQSYKSPDR